MKSKLALWGLVALLLAGGAFGTYQGIVARSALRNAQDALVQAVQSKQVLAEGNAMDKREQTQQQARVARARVRVQEQEKKDEAAGSPGLVPSPEWVREFNSLIEEANGS